MATLTSNQALVNFVIYFNNQKKNIQSNSGYISHIFIYPTEKVQASVAKLRQAMAVVVLNKCRIVLRRLFIVGLGLTPHFTPHTEHQVNGEAASSSTEENMT